MPNGVLAPYWTDLAGEGAPGILLAILEDTVTGAAWLVAEWQELILGTDVLVVAQTWIGLNGVEDITYSYAEDTIGVAPP